jgi:NADH:ubiquinone oxidoreductase subunit 3 (subunit A)
MNHCPECGAKLKENANFCRECGVKIKSSEIKNVSERRKTKLWFFITAILISIFNIISQFNNMFYWSSDKIARFNLISYFVLGGIILVYLVYLYAKEYEAASKIVCWILLFSFLVFIISTHTWGRDYRSYRLLYLIYSFISGVVILVISLYYSFKRYL